MWFHDLKIYKITQTNNWLGPNFISLPELGAIKIKYEDFDCKINDEPFKDLRFSYFKNDHWTLRTGQDNTFGSINCGNK